LGGKIGGRGKRRNVGKKVGLALSEGREVLKVGKRGGLYKNDSKTESKRERSRGGKEA